MLYRFFILFLLWTYSCNASLDLETGKVQDFVIETKQIILNEYPTALNPSIVRWKDRFLMSFRIIPGRTQKYTSHVGLVFLDKNFNPISKPQILQLRDPHSRVPSRAEDARLLVVGGSHLYIVYDDNPYPALSRGGFRMYVADLKWDGKEFSVHNKKCLSEYEGQDSNVREKSWVPFDYKGKLHLAYSLMPHIIFFPNLKAGACTTVSSSLSKTNWNHGTLRGGTPALQIGNEYLSFFHSSKAMTTIHSHDKKALHYFMGAYTFSTCPPFAITRISPEPIIGKGFYSGMSYVPYHHPVKVIFPCGFVSNEKYIWVLYGRDDYENWVVKLDRVGLLKSLLPVSTEKVYLNTFHKEHTRDQGGICE